MSLNSHAALTKILGNRHWLLDITWYSGLFLLLFVCMFNIYNFLSDKITLQELWHVLTLGFITFFKIIILILLSAIFLVPLRVYIRLRSALTQKVQPLIQFLSAFPANIMFPVFVIVIMRYNLNHDIFLSPLLILGSLWYILFNIIAGISAFPNDLKEAASSFNIRGWRWWRKIIIPGIFPYLVTGMITATGAAWNASIVAEAVSWGNASLYAYGLGAYIAQRTVAADYHHIALGIFIMSIYVTFLNKVIWRKLYQYSEKNMRLD